MFSIYTFDLWVFTGAHDVFVVVVNFLSNNWEPKHVTIGLFEAIAITSATIAPKLWELLDRFSRTYNIFAYVKDEGLICNFV